MRVSREASVTDGRAEAASVWSNPLTDVAGGGWGCCLDSLRVRETVRAKRRGGGLWSAVGLAYGLTDAARLLRPFADMDL